jgi:hypothetical protein
MRHDGRGYVSGGRACQPRGRGRRCALRGRQVADRRRARGTRRERGAGGQRSRRQTNWCGDDGRPVMGCGGELA